MFFVRELNWDRLGHVYLDRLAALPQSHLTDLPRVSGGRRDHSFSYQAIYLRKERILRGTAQEIFSKSIHTVSALYLPFLSVSSNRPLWDGLCVLLGQVGLLQRTSTHESCLNTLCNVI